MQPGIHPTTQYIYSHSLIKNNIHPGPLTPDPELRFRSRPRTCPPSNCHSAGKNTAFRKYSSESTVNLEDAQTGATTHHLCLKPPTAPAAHNTTSSTQINCTFVQHCSPSLRNIPGKAKSGQGEGSWNNRHLVHHKESLSAGWPRQGAFKHMDSLSSHESTRQTAALPTRTPVL